MKTTLLIIGIAVILTGCNQVDFGGQYISKEQDKILKEQYKWQQERIQGINKLTDDNKPPQASIDKIISNHNKLSNDLKNYKVKNNLLNYIPNFIMGAWAYDFGLEGFENGDKGTFDTTNDSDEGAAWGSCAVTYNGGSLITGTYTEGVACTGEGPANLYEDLSNYSEVYVQFKLHYPSGWGWGAGSYAGLVNFVDDSINDRLYLNMEDWGNNELTLGGDVAWTDTSLSLSANNTYKIEFYIKKSTTAGDVKIWVDNNTEGSPDYDHAGTDTGATAISGFKVGNSYADNSFDAYYIDDVIISDSFIGAGTPSDTCTPPATGDWTVMLGDDCYVVTDTYITGDLILIDNLGSGCLNIIDGATLAVAGWEATSTRDYICLESDDGSELKTWTAS